jgi:hypothetical protein
MITLFYCLRRLPTLSVEEFSAYWSGPHARLVCSHSAKLGIVRYVQHHGVSQEAALAMQAARGLQTPFDGIAEICFQDFDSLERANLSPQAAAAQAALAEDEDRFIDRLRSSIVLARAKTIIAGVNT